MKFGEIWSTIETTLKNNAGGIGVEANRIRKGKIGVSMSLKPPFVYIYAFPNDGRQGENARLNSTSAYFEIYCGAGGYQSDVTLDEAIKLAGRCITALESIEYLSFNDPPIDIDSVTSSMSVVSLGCSADVQLKEDLIS